MFLAGCKKKERRKEEEKEESHVNDLILNPGPLARHLLVHHHHATALARTRSASPCLSIPAYRDVIELIAMHAQLLNHFVWFCKVFVG